ncbi:MAG: ribosome biogenesis GTP-binding protein YihA/YsxC [Candidatus Binatia bacterium]
MSRLDLEYAGSAEHPAEYPRWAAPEIAIAGRSNAGKSSLLNSIARSRNLARVSKTPGRTQRLHFFLAERAGFALVDLPGYGFARVSKDDRRRFASAVEAYLTERPNLRAILLVIDVRRGLEDDERLLRDFAASRGVELLAVATKIDKLGRAERARRLGDLDRSGLGSWLPFSATTDEGRDAVIAALARVAGRRSA